MPAGAAVRGRAGQGAAEVANLHAQQRVDRRGQQRRRDRVVQAGQQFPPVQPGSGGDGLGADGAQLGHRQRATRFGKMGYGSSVWGQEFRLLLTTFTCDRGRGRVAETLDGLLASAEDPSLTPLRPIAVLAALDSGRPDLARELVARWGTEVPDDWIADFLIPVWGLVAARLGLPDPGELYDRLAPYADQLIVAGTGSTAWGSTHLVLAELAARLGRADRAREHAREAAGTHRRLGLAHLEERSLRPLARLS